MERIKKLLVRVLALALVCALLAGCGAGTTTTQTAGTVNLTGISTAVGTLETKFLTNRQRQSFGMYAMAMISPTKTRLRMLSMLTLNL